MIAHGVWKATKKYDATDLVLADSKTTAVKTAEFKMTPATKDKNIMGTTFATTVEITVSAEADWTLALSLWMMCGTTAAVGVHGTPNWDSKNAATSGCLSY